jgi:hypothetical protein
MKHFRRIDHPGLSTQLPALISELENNETLWLADQRRQQRIAVQRHTHSIPIRSARISIGEAKVVDDIHDSCFTAFASAFPHALALLTDISARLGASLERAAYVRLLPNSVVYPHVDVGKYYEIRDRYHLVVISDGGSYLKSGEEEVFMAAGELWWFDNKALHESHNPSPSHRVHLIFDLL